jgi:hypothetical protein
MIPITKIVNALIILSLKFILKPLLATSYHKFFENIKIFGECRWDYIGLESSILSLSTTFTGRKSQ